MFTSLCIVCDRNWNNMASKALNIYYLILYTKRADPCPKAMVRNGECSSKLTWESFSKNTYLQPSHTPFWFNSWLSTTALRIW